jgi:K+-transporting ATPase ATPase C chain
MFFTQLRPALLHLTLLTVITGLVYPLAITLAGGVVFPTQAKGDMDLIGWAFDEPRYFWPRPSATAPGPYNLASSSGSNLGPLSPELQKAVAERRARLAGEAPVDLLTASGSGLDPHISPEAAYFQAGRVAAARGLAEADVRRLIAEVAEGRQWGFLGEPRVNVVHLNRRLDGQR